MPTSSPDLLAVYVDGETKTGKGAAGKAIASALQDKGLSVRYDVAGDFFRRYVVLVRQYLKLNDTEPLPGGEVLERAAAAVHDKREAYRNDLNLGDLQRPVISQSVALLGELPLAQKAGAEWWAMTLNLAQQSGVKVLVVDGRNPRYKLLQASQETGIKVQSILDLFMTCEAEEAARRVLRFQNNDNPSATELSEARKKIELRRKQDRERSARPFIEPNSTVKYEPLVMSSEDAIERSWIPHGKLMLPIAIELDNTHFTEQEMTAAVRGLAIAALEYMQK